MQHVSPTSPPYTNTTYTVSEKFSLTPSEKLTFTLHHNSVWLCKQLKCEISQRFSRKPFDTLKKIRRDYTSLGGGLSETVNSAFQPMRVGDFFLSFFSESLGKTPEEEEVLVASFQTHLRPWIFLSKLSPASHSLDAAALPLLAQPFNLHPSISAFRWRPVNTKAFNALPSTFSL